MGEGGKETSRRRIDSDGLYTVAGSLLRGSTENQPLTEVIVFLNSVGPCVLVLFDLYNTQKQAR